MQSFLDFPFDYHKAHRENLALSILLLATGLEFSVARNVCSGAFQILEGMSFD